MKKILLGSLILLFLFPATKVLSQTTTLSNVKESKKGLATNDKTTAASVQRTMTWTCSSEAAKELGLAGAVHFINAEPELGYQELQDALKIDPDFTVALVFMANMSYGATRKAYQERAIKSAANKTEGEKLFASLADENNKGDKSREIISKLHEMFPDGGIIWHLYVVSRATLDERFKAAQEYVAKFPEAGNAYNVLAYCYMEKKDYPDAKKNFDKYLELYPDGPNSYDSMGEYYLAVGDNANSEKYYKLALEKYPLFPSSQQAIEKINKAKEATEKTK
jgi:Tfp pilus assembly protein PilF